jgi:hypothetical protein
MSMELFWPRIVLVLSGPILSILLILLTRKRTPRGVRTAALPSEWREPTHLPPWPKTPHDAGQIQPPRPDAAAEEAVREKPGL